MSEPTVRKGFFGKLPGTGDFVTRGLPSAFVKSWDCWLTRHLAPRLACDAPPLYFHRPGTPAFTGVVVPSRDSAGRLFPLTLAAECRDGLPAAASLGTHDPEIGLRFAVTAVINTWLMSLAALAKTAVREAFPGDTLAARLAALSDPAGTWPQRFLLWTDPGSAFPIDPDQPRPILDALIGAPAKAG
jgi:type VI secretion system protein ImpM